MNNNEQTLKEDPCDDYGFCKYCGWNSCYPESHIRYGNRGCDYINKQYYVFMNEDGEINFVERSLVKEAR